MKSKIAEMVKNLISFATDTISRKKRQRITPASASLQLVPYLVSRSKISLHILRQDSSSSLSIPLFEVGVRLKF